MDASSVVGHWRAVTCVLLVDQIPENKTFFFLTHYFTYEKKTSAGNDYYTYLVLLMNFIKQ